VSWSRWLGDVSLGLFLCLCVGVVFVVFMSYRELPPLYFPQKSQDFRSVVVREQDRDRALAVLTKEPDNLKALTDMALISFEEGDSGFVKGLEFLEKARDLGALDSRLFYYAGIMYEAKGLPDYAIQEFEKFLRHYPSDGDVRSLLAGLYLRQGDFEKSAAAYRSVLTLHPGDPFVLYHLALACRGLKNWNEGLEALTPFTNGVVSLPAGGHKLLGDLYAGAEEFDSAEKEYRLAQAEGDGDASAREGLANVLERLNKKEEALSVWKTVLVLDPTHREALRKTKQLQRSFPRR